MPLTDYPTYDKVGVRPLINCKGTLTIIQRFGHASRGQAGHGRGVYKVCTHRRACGRRWARRIGEIMDTEFGLVTNGCAAALCQGTAACVAGTDPNRIARLPDTTGMKNEVITLRTHRHVL